MGAVVTKQYGSSTSLCDYILRQQIKQVGPKDVVDFGAGGGKNGRLVKQVIGKGCRLIAVEGFERTVNMLSAQGLYDDVQHDLIQNWIKSESRSYDLAIFGDVLEHLTSREIHGIIKKSRRIFKTIIIIAPLHDIFQDEAYGNPLEVHRSYITQRFFDRYYPVEKHIVRGNGRTIMNVRIVSDLKIEPCYRRTFWAVFHLSMVVLQPLGLARPAVNLLKRFFLRYKWLLRD
jgi:SAM-dependent methyltransferase